MGRWKKKRYNSGWSLMKYSDCTKSYLLSVPRDVDLSAIVTSLSSLPGHTKVITEETYSGYDITFCYSAPFNTVFSNLKSLLSIPYEVQTTKRGSNRRAVVLYKDGVAVAEYPSILACSKALNILPSSVSYSVQGQRRKKNKLDIRYKDEKRPVEDVKT